MSLSFFKSRRQSNELSETVNRLVDSLKTGQAPLKELLDGIDEATLHDITRLSDILRADSLAEKTMQPIYKRDEWYYTTLQTLPTYLSEEQEGLVEEFWKPYEFAYKNDSRLQGVFTGMSGKFDPSYIPFGLLTRYLNRYWNHETFLFVRNKNNLDLLFPDVRHPRVLVRNMYARWYTEDRTLIDRETAIGIVFDYLQGEGAEQAVVKPDDAGEGRGIEFLEPGSSRDDIAKAFDAARMKFLVQVFQHEHESLAAPHPGSLNTLRMVTHMRGSTVNYVGTFWRIGVGDSKIDNLGRGNVACRVEPDGTCAPYVYNDYGEVFDKHPDGFELAGHVVYNFPKAIEAVKRSHEKVPQINLLSWDVVIDPDGEPVILEVNLPGGSEAFQPTGIPFLGSKEITKAVLDKYLRDDFFYKRSSWNWDYREYWNKIILEKGVVAPNEDSIVVPDEIDGKPVQGILAHACNELANIRKCIVPARLMENGTPDAIRRLIDNGVEVEVDKGEDADQAR